MSRTKGNAAEEQGTRWLEQQGFTILDRNWIAKGGELDIIARKAGVIHFVEVKSGTGFEAVYNLTPAKLSRVIRTAQNYLKAKKLDLPFSIDAMIVQEGEVEFLENITL